MVAIVVGLVVGGLVALGPLPWLRWPALHVADAAVALAAKGAAAGLAPAAARWPHSTAVVVVEALTAALLPAFAAAALLVAARASLWLRRGVVWVVLGVAVAGFAVLPAGQAVPLAVFCLVAASAAAFSGALIGGALAGCGGFLALSVSRAAWQGRAGSGVRGAAATLGRVSHVSGATWETVLAVAAIGVCAGALAAVVRSSR